MRFSLGDIYSIVSESGLKDPSGFPLRAVMASIGHAEGAGDPNAFVAHDPPSDPNAPPSSGLYQVHRGSWPEIFEKTERIRLSLLSDRDKVMGMTELVRPIIADALHAAARANRVLAARGIRVNPLDMALFIDATWQAGAGHLERWARRTTTGDPREIVNPRRTAAVEVSLRRLASQALGLDGSYGMVLGALVAFGLAAYIMSQWKS